METRAHHILIGLFTVIVIGAALLFGLWLGKAGSDKQFSFYDIVFNEAVSGLSQGSAVQFNGIRIGEVTSLKIDPRDPRRVLARIRVDSQAPIRADTEARLALAGITGISIIRFNGINPDSPPLQAEDGKVPVIVASPSPFSKLMSGGEDIMLNVNELISQARELFSTANVAHIERTLANLEQSTSSLADQREEIAHALKAITNASEQANAALLEATQAMKTTNGLLDKEGRQTLDSAREAMAAFERTMVTVDSLVADNRGQLDSGVRGLSEIGPAIGELRSTLQSLRGITRRLEENPTGYLLGADKSKEFQP